MRCNLMRRLIGDRQGNVAIIFALSLIPIVFLTGMAMDFSSATSKRIRLNAAADAAALAAVTPTMMGQTRVDRANRGAKHFQRHGRRRSGNERCHPDRQRHQQQ